MGGRPKQRWKSQDLLDDQWEQVLMGINLTVEDDDDDYDDDDGD